MIIPLGKEMDSVLGNPRQEHSPMDFLMTHTGLLMYRTIRMSFVRTLVTARIIFVKTFIMQ